MGRYKVKYADEMIDSLQISPKIVDNLKDTLFEIKQITERNGTTITSASMASEIRNHIDRELADALIEKLQEYPSVVFYFLDDYQKFVIDTINRLEEGEDIPKNINKQDLLNEYYILLEKI